MGGREWGLESGGYELGRVTSRAYGAGRRVVSGHLRVARAVAAVGERAEGGRTVAREKRGAPSGLERCPRPRQRRGLVLCLAGHTRDERI